MRIIQLLILLLLVRTSFGQNFNEVSNEIAIADLKKLAKNYSISNYQLNYTKSVFQNTSDATPLLKTSGTMYRGKQNEYRMEEKGTLIIQNNKHKIVVDSTLNLVTIDKSDTLFSGLNIEQYAQNSSLELYSFKKKEDKIYLIYLIESSNKSEGITELWIKKKDFTLERITLKLPAANYFNDALDDETMETPLVIINYQQPILLTNSNNMFLLTDWVVSEGNSSEDNFKISPNKTGFKLHDLRYKKTN